MRKQLDGCCCTSFAHVHVLYIVFGYSSIKMVKIADVHKEHAALIGVQSIRNHYDLDMMLYKDLTACIMSVQYPLGTLERSD